MSLPPKVPNFALACLLNLIGMVKYHLNCSAVLPSNPILTEVFDLLLCQQYGYIYCVIKKSDDSLWSEINLVAAYINLYYAYINQWSPT